MTLDKKIMLIYKYTNEKIIKTSSSGIRLKSVDLEGDVLSQQLVTAFD